ncbi:MAG: Coq4 family protein [Pseudomonadota bacterium]
MSQDRQKMQPLVAWQALRRLINDPEATHEVFTVIRALSGPSLKQGYQRFAATPFGQKVFRERIDLLDTLQDRDYLAAQPHQSLAQHYLHFVRSENLSADGLVEASDDETLQMDEDMTRFSARQRDMHDLWHTLTEYGRDELGEACLLAFTYAQTRNRGLGVICLAGCLQLSKHYGKGVFSAAWRAYKDGKRAAWLPGQNWEYLLTQPINEVRNCLGIQPPERYVDLRNMVAAPA